MTQFALFATLLVVVVAAFILPPLWLGLRVPKTRADRKTANLAIFRDHRVNSLAFSLSEELVAGRQDPAEGFATLVADRADME